MESASLLADKASIITEIKSKLPRTEDTTPPLVMGYNIITTETQQKHNSSKSSRNVPMQNQMIVSFAIGTAL